MQLILAYDNQYLNSPTNPASPVRAWSFINDAGHVKMSGTTETLVEIVKRTRGYDFITTVLLMSPDVLVTQIPRPAGSMRKLQQALPYLLEEQLADDVEDLHFAVLNNEPTTLVIAVIKKDILRSCLDELTAADLAPRVILPLWFALPIPAPEHWQIFVTEDYVWLRMTEFTGYSFERQFAAEFSVALQQKLPPKEIDCVTVDIIDPTMVEQFQTRNVITHSTVLRDPKKWLNYVAEKFPKTNANLLQGEFSVSQRSGEEQRWWIIAKRLAVSIVVIWFSGLFLQYLYLSWEYNKLENQIADTYREVFPDATTISNPRAVFDREIGRVSDGQTGTDFLSMLLRTGEILGDFPQVTVLGLNYNNQQINLNFTADNFSRLQQLEERFMQAGLKVEKESAASTKGVVQANWSIR